MRLVVDANVVLSGLFRDGTTRELLRHAPLDVYAPERLDVEVGRHVDEVARRGNIDRVRLQAVLARLLDQVQMVPAALIAPHAAEAIRRCRRAGRNDAAYVACCLAIDALLWTHDRRLASEAGVDVATTKDLADGSSTDPHAAAGAVNLRRLVRRAANGPGTPVSPTSTKNPWTSDTHRADMSVIAKAGLLRGGASGAQTLITFLRNCTNMQERFPESWNTILEVLQTSPSPLALSAIADRIDLAPSTVHRHLREMDRLGLVRRTGRRKDARYEPRPFVSTFWTAPVQALRARTGSPAWLRFEWGHTGLVDWRFPLVSRLPDVDAQRTILRLLDTAWKRGILTPWLRSANDLDVADDVPPDRRGETQARLADPDHHEGTTWVVYGSAARGDARAESDIDLLVILPANIPDNEPHPPLKAEIAHLVDDINLGASRPIDHVTVPRDGFYDELPTPLRHAIVREGMTVLSTFPGGEFIEAAQEDPAREG